MEYLYDHDGHTHNDILQYFIDEFPNANQSNLNENELWEYLKTKFDTHEDPKSNKLSHYIFQLMEIA